MIGGQPEVHVTAAAVASCLLVLRCCSCFFDLAVACAAMYVRVAWPCG